MQFHLGTSCFSAFMLVSSSCFADPPPVLIQPIQGNLFVSAGQGFQPINGPVNANVGDAVMIAPGGTAMVAYPDGCKVAVQPGQVTTIVRISP